MGDNEEAIPVPQEAEAATLMELINNHAGNNQEADLDKVFKRILDDNNLEFFTDLSQNEITAFSVLGTIAEEHDLTIVKRFLLKNLKLRVSKKRGGRKDLVKILSKFNPGMESQEQRRGGFFWGRGRGPT